MSQIPEIETLAGATHHLGASAVSVTASMPDREYKVQKLNVGSNYLEAMGIKLQSGRFFDDKRQGESNLAVVNELFVKNLALMEPIGQTFKMDTTTYRIIGVVQDFHMYSFFSAMEPCIFTRVEPTQFNYLAIQAMDGSEIDVYDELKAEWSVLFPEIPFDGGFQADIWGSYFMRLNTAEHFYKVIASIAVMLASLGLYGLISLNVSGRIKEFSIRKVLGAGMLSLSRSVSRQYLILLGISLVAGIPFSYWLGKAALAMLYHYPMPMTVTGVLIAAALLILVLLVVIATQVRNLAKANPVDGLRTE